MPKWYIIAKNEYRMITSSIPKLRIYLPVLAVIVIAILIGYGLPLLINRFVDEVIAFFVSVAAVAIIQIVLFMLFFYFLTFPISLALRDVQADQNEIFLSAPIKASDVLLGKYMGIMPFYAIVITIVATIFTAVVDPLGIDILQKVIIIIIFIVVSLSGLWIGTVITAILRTKLGKTARGRDIGKALGILIALPLIAVMYALMGGGLLQALADPTTSGNVRTMLNILPSSWGAEVIISFVFHPGDIPAVWFETLSGFGGLLLFYITILWLGKKAANRAYSLEQTSFAGSTAKPDGAFYHSIKYMGGGKSFGTLLVSMFKDYGRRLQNITWIIYIVGLMVLILIFFNDPNDPMGSVMMSNFIYPLLAAVVVGDVTIRGKENLFIYRKMPYGEDKFVKARLLQSWLVVIPIVTIISIISLSLIPNIPIISIFGFTGYFLLLVIANIAFALGLFLIKPAFSEKSSEFIANMMTIVMVNTILFIFLIIIFNKILGMIAFIVIIWLIF
jgi:hypothetical protein